MNVKQFFDDYFNIKKMVASKREYQAEMKRVHALPKEYQLVFKKIVTYMWQFSAGPGYDMMQVQSDLIDLFEEGAANGRSVLAITGNDVAAFVEGLLESTRTYAGDWKTKFNRDILQALDAK